MASIQCLSLRQELEEIPTSRTLSVYPSVQPLFPNDFNNAPYKTVNGLNPGVMSQGHISNS